MPRRGKLLTQRVNNTVSLVKQELLPVSPSGNSNTPKVLVLLATFNGWEWVQEQIESILYQEQVDLKIAIFDDCSSDGTIPVLERNYAGHSQISLYFSPSPSGSASGNFYRIFRAIDVAPFEFVALSDQDDIWLPDKLISAIKSLDAIDADGYSSGVRAFWPSGAVKSLRQNQHVRTADFLFEGAGQGCTFVLKSSFFHRIQHALQIYSGKLDSFHFHDWMIYFLARTWNMKWVFDDRCLIRYRQHESNEIGSRGSISAVVRRVKKIRNGWYRHQVSIASKLFLQIGEPDSAARHVAECFAGTVSTSRFRKAYLVFRHGRRRIVDRMVLVFAVMVGWL